MKPSVHLVSLGCAKNLVDSEVMLGTLLRAGHPIEPAARDADVVIVNTCGFIEPARKESIEAVLRAALPNNRAARKKVIVAGCLAQRNAQELAAEIPEASAFIGINEVPRIAEIVMRVAEGGTTRAAGGADPRVLVSRKPTWLYDFASPRHQATPAHYAWIKIAEGCNHPCAFCAIPIMRGRHRSRPAADIEAEARALVRGGAKELLLISQDTTWYGRDLGDRRGIAGLVRRLDAIEGDFWIRLHYTHPAHWSDDLVRAMAECPKVCRYVDMPLQHIHDEMLQRMRRETDRAWIERWVARLREGLPGATFRTSFIVGFPGETERHFEALLRFVQKAAFERVGVFEYSKEEGTIAARMEVQTTARVRRERRRRVMAAQRVISARLMRARIGGVERVLVEKGGRGAWGRTAHEAPGVDGRVLLRGSGWTAGEFAEARIVGASDYDVAAEKAAQ
ncbi:MAG: 30S ribosomal protein S12 methylthiotransferase RimO [Verrucomicrobiae bacterium]|nr:30S ribosomal protein S12 methylthiotransferase RimO [Verrucomicrobiae bacterium]